MQSPRPEVIHLTREQLHELVWRKPVSTLAREFGVSDVALAKWCKKLNVPRPGLGYWAKIQAGKKVAPKKLPAPGPGTPSACEIHTREVAAFGSQERFASEPVFESVPVLQALEKPHPLVARTRKALANAPVRNGLLVNASLECAPVHVSKGTLNRALRILDALLGAVTRAGWTIELDPKAPPCVGVDGVRVPFSLEEIRTAGAKPFELFPSGLLRLVLSEPPGRGGMRHTFKDGRTRRLEDVLDAVCLGMWRYAQGVEAWEAEREAEQREREARARAAELERQRVLLEERRQQHLDDRLALRRRAREIRELHAAITQAPPSSPRNEAWLTWMCLQAEACDREAVAPPWDECRFAEA